MWCLWLALACAPESIPPRPQGAEVVERVLPSVVLLVAEREDGRTEYGSGSIVEPQKVLTNLHVVDDATRVRAMLYDPARPTWSPLEGGLDRFLFEHEPELLDGTVERTERSLDLAIVAIDAAAGTDRVLPVRIEPVALGEAVFALGHPNESLWSFTAGVVSALHQGVIQHDAPISPGSSGGPLVDSAGRLVGVNTSKLLGDAEGVGFARPLSLAQVLLDGMTAPVLVDRSAPDKAMLTCEHALDLSPALAESCFDWDSSIELLDLAADRAAELASLPEAQAARWRAWLEGEGRGKFVSDFEASVAAHLSVAPERPPRTFLPPDVWGSVEARDRHYEAHGLEARFRDEGTRIDAAARAFTERLKRENALDDDLTADSRAYQEARRRGARIDRVEIAGDVAWIEVLGRNADDSTYRYTECWRRTTDGWKQPFLCMATVGDSFPKGFPSIAVDEQGRIHRSALRWAAELMGRDATVWLPSARAAPPAVVSAPASAVKMGGAAAR